MKSFSFIAIFLSIIFCSCSDNNEPTSAPSGPARLTGIYGNDESQEFSYKDDKVSKYVVRNPVNTTQVEYFYDDANSIRIVTTTDFQFGFPTLKGENLYLDSDGKATRSEGVMFVKKNTNTYNAVYKYQYDFTYNSFRELVSVRLTLWSKDGEGWGESPEIYESTLEWEDGNMVKCADGVSYPDSKLVINYKYAGNVSVKGSPFAYPYICHGYTPLQLAGYFGKQSEALVSSANIVNELGITTSWQYTYRLAMSVSASKSRVDGYTIIDGNGQKTDYRIDWGE